jgi:ribosomal protein S18 acetylase RimI-like enzyme
MKDERARLIERYAAGHREIMALLASPARLPLDAAPGGEWSARQIVHHLADTEVVRAERLRRLLSQDAPVIQAIDETLLAERAHYSRPVETSLLLFDAAVRSTTELLQLMTESDWAREGVHTEFGPYSLHYWLERASEHLPQHAEQLRAALEASGAGSASLSIEALPQERLAGWLHAFLERHHATRVVSRGRMQYPATLPGFVAMRGGVSIAVATYRLDGDECEMVTLHADVENAGAGSALVAAVRSVASGAGCRRIWLITTNDNTRAIRFYQRRGFRIAAAHVGAIDELSRPMKPEIPFTGNDGIRIRDEIEMELQLAPVS